MRGLYEFVNPDKDSRTDATFPNMLLLVKNEFVTMCEMQKGYIRNIEELNNQVKELISEITTREFNDQNEDSAGNPAKSYDNFEETQYKQVQLVMNDY